MGAAFEPDDRWQRPAATHSGLVHRGRPTLESDRRDARLDRLTRKCLKAPALPPRCGMPTRMQSVASPLLWTARDDRSPLPLDSRFRKWPWVRDFALVGAATGFLAPYAVIRSLEYSGFASAGGGASGALLGAFSVWLFSRVGRGWSKIVLVPLGLALGALWGGAAGLATGLSDHGEWLPLSVMFGGCAGALQLGWFWLAYAVRRVNCRSTIAVVVTATVLSGSLGWVAIHSIMFAVDISGVRTFGGAESNRLPPSRDSTRRPEGELLGPASPPLRLSERAQARCSSRGDGGRRAGHPRLAWGARAGRTANHRRS